MTNYVALFRGITDGGKQTLEEVTRLVTRRHGLPRYAESGLSAYKASLYRNLLSTLMQDKNTYLDPELTLSQLASQIGCSMDHMSRVINTEFGTDFHIFINERRLRFARDLLLEKSDNLNYVFHVAVQSGFQSFEDFSNTFAEMFGVTPEVFCSQRTEDIDPTS
jgi:AraC-like DNA-binding protein